MPQLEDPEREDPFYNDLNKIFIPYRTVLEMEALLGLYLAVSNYELIKEVPKSRPSSDQLLEILNMKDNPAYQQIITCFMNSALKLKPIVTYERNHHDAERWGNVAPYAKTRACLYFALHNLKVKFLLMKEFIAGFKGKKYKLDSLPSSKSKSPPSLLFAFGHDFYEKYRAILNDMLPLKQISGTVKGLLENKDAITNEKVLQMLIYLSADEERNKIKYIMRSVKASFFT